MYKYIMCIKFFISAFLFLLCCFNLFSEITEEDFNKKGLISWEIDTKVFDRLSELTPHVPRSTLAFEYRSAVIGSMIKNLLKSKQGQYLIQALDYQRQKLIATNHSVSIQVKIEKSLCGLGSRTNFSYDKEKKLFSVIITLVICEHDFKIQTIRRPILIKQNGFFSLHHLELPNYIIVAHELLHALNHMELFISFINNKADKNVEDNLDKIFSGGDKDRKNFDRAKAIQGFLRQKLLLLPDHCILNQECTNFWKNSYSDINIDDSLDEMTTILCSLHEISEGRRIRIGETLFLREHYTTYPNLISWSHNAVQEDTVMMKAQKLLFNSYVDKVLNIFALAPHCVMPSKEPKLTIQESNSLICTQGATSPGVYVYSTRTRVNTQNVILLKQAPSLMYNFLQVTFDGVTLPSGVVSSKKISREEILNHVFSAISISEKEQVDVLSERSFGAFQTRDVHKDGNCAFWAVLIASRDSTVQSDEILNLRKQTADLAAKKGADPWFVEILRSFGQWDAGIQGGVGLEALHYVAKCLGRRIILVENGGGVFSYWDSQANNLALNEILESGIETFLDNVRKEDPGSIFIYHEGNHFQALVRDTPSDERR